jgi:hypothetical protein
MTEEGRQMPDKMNIIVTSYSQGEKATWFIGSHLPFFAELKIFPLAAMGGSPPRRTDQTARTKLF